MKRELYLAYLNLGSNILAEINLPKAVQLLKNYGEISAVSRVWESESVGFNGPNFLNACLAIKTPLKPETFKEDVIRPIEAQLGRIRHAEKNAPRPMDIDIVLFNNTPWNVDYWKFAFVAVPLAELIPDFKHPLSGEKLSVFARQARGSLWIIPREDVVIS